MEATANWWTVDLDCLPRMLKLPTCVISMTVHYQQINIQSQDPTWTFGIPHGCQDWPREKAQGQRNLHTHHPHYRLPISQNKLERRENIHRRCDYHCSHHRGCPSLPGCLVYQARETSTSTAPARATKPQPRSILSIIPHAQRRHQQSPGTIPHERCQARANLPHVQPQPVSLHHIRRGQRRCPKHLNPFLPQ